MSFFEDYIADGLFDPDTEEWNLDGYIKIKKQKNKKPYELPRCFLPVATKPTKQELRQASHLVFVAFKDREHAAPVTTIGA